MKRNIAMSWLDRITLATGWFEVMRSFSAFGCGNCGLSMGALCVSTCMWGGLITLFALNGNEFGTRGAWNEFELLIHVAMLLGYAAVVLAGHLLFGRCPAKPDEAVDNGVSMTEAVQSYIAKV